MTHSSPHPLHTSAWTEVLCVHTASPQWSTKKPTACVMMGTTGASLPSSPSTPQNPNSSRRQSVLLAQFPNSPSPQQCDKPALPVQGMVSRWAHLGHAVQSPIRDPWTSSKWVKASTAHNTAEHNDSRSGPRSNKTTLAACKTMLSSLSGFALKKK